MIHSLNVARRRIETHYATLKSFKIFNCSTKWFELCPVWGALKSNTYIMPDVSVFSFIFPVKHRISL